MPLNEPLHCPPCPRPPHPPAPLGCRLLDGAGRLLNSSDGRLSVPATAWDRSSTRRLLRCGIHGQSATHTPALLLTRNGYRTSHGWWHISDQRLFTTCSVGINH